MILTWVSIVLGSLIIGLVWMNRRVTAQRDRLLESVDTLKARRDDERRRYERQFRHLQDTIDAMIAEVKALQSPPPKKSHGLLQYHKPDDT